MLSERLTLCISAFNSALGDSQANLKRIAEEADFAASSGAQLLVTSEASVCGHACGAEIREFSEPLHGTSVEALTNLARKHDLAISAGIAETNPSPNGWPFNTQVLVGPEGLISKQRKLHLSGNENCFHHPGDSLDVAEIGSWRIGTVICYDNQFPEIHRLLALKGCELILAPHAGRGGIGNPTGKTAKDFEAVKREFLGRSRIRFGGLAMANELYVAVVNQAGIAGRVQCKMSEGWVAHAGGILALGPDGSVLAESPSAQVKDERVIVTLDRAAVVRRRAQAASSLNFRRTELFAELSEPVLVNAYRERYRPPELGPWWAQEGVAPARRP